MNSGRKALLSVLSFWTAFFLISLLNSSYVAQVDYIAYQYGFPITWLVHQTSGLFPQDTWIVLWYAAVLDYTFWLLVSLAATLIVHRVSKFSTIGISLVIFSFPFLSFLGFDPLLILVGLSILACGLISIVLGYDNSKSRHHHLNGKEEEIVNRAKTV